MLEVTIPGVELYDEETNTFITTNATTIKLEHSLLSISKWESKYKRPFLSKTDNKSSSEMLDYIKMMTITPNITDNIYKGLTPSIVKSIQEYIEDPMTATTINSKHVGSKNNGREITNELIYCWMTQMSIPFSCEKWHISRLLTLINVCGIENQPPKKMDQKSILRQNAALNKARRAKYGSKG